MTTALGDRSRTGVLLANDLGTSNEPVNNLYVNNIIPPAGGATLQNVCDNGNETTTNLIVKGTGRLGVGTTTPEKLLHIKGDTAPTLRITDTPNNTRLDLLSGDTSATIETFSNHPLLIGTNNQERMRITAGGDVGIGTTAPSSLLEIKGAGAKHIIHATSGNPELEFNDDGTDEFSIYFDTGNKSLNFNEAGIGTHLAIKDGGNVGIGTTSPAVKLDVNGSIRGATEVVNQSSGAISAVNCYGDTIYADTSGFTLTLPAGVVGMNLQIINDSGGAITLAVTTGDYLDSGLNATENLTISGSKPYLHKVVCGATGKWFLSHP